MAPAPSALAGGGADRARRVELADIVRPHGAAYQHTHPLCRAQRRALRAIATCRTAALGGHRAVCTACVAERISYNSCRNRHCPKCQCVATARGSARAGATSSQFRTSTSSSRSPTPSTRWRKGIPV